MAQDQIKALAARVCPDRQRPRCRGAPSHLANHAATVARLRLAGLDRPPHSQKVIGSGKSHRLVAP